MKLILTNSSSDACSYLSGSVIVPAATDINTPGSIDVSSLYWFSLYTDTAFIKDIRLNNIAVSDGNQTLASDQSEVYLKLINDFNYNNKDTDGAVIVRSKAAKKGWTFWALPMEISTAKIGGSLYCKNSGDVNIPGITCKIYDGDNAEITVAGDGDANLATCIKTVLDFEPPFDYEIIGGILRMVASTDQNMRLWIVGAPDIPAIYGGSKEFASGVNLKFLGDTKTFEVDGRVTKFLTYNASNHQSKMRLILKHPAGVSVDLQFIIHLYRQ